MNVDQYFQSKSTSLKASELPPGQQVRVTIETCEEVVFKEDDGTDKPKIRLGFTDKEKGLILNKTNAMSIGHVYGPNTDEWLGKEIFLYSTKVDFGGNMVDAIRVNIPMQEATDAPPF